MQAGASPIEASPLVELELHPLGQRLVLTRPKLATFEEALDALRHFVQDLGNYTEGSPAQRQQVEIWWPLFKREFEAAAKDKEKKKTFVDRIVALVTPDKKKK